MIRIKVADIDFSKAESNGFVYGWDLTKTMTRSVYVDLGIETDYMPSHRDDPKTEYRRFINCHVCYAYSDEMADEGKFVHEASNQTVVIYN